VSSAPGEGATFVVDLPVGECAEGPIEKPNTVRGRARLPEKARAKRVRGDEEEALRDLI